MELPNIQLKQLIAVVEQSRFAANPLERLTNAVVLAGRLDELADELVGHFVDGARSSGSSWADIGQVLGVTRQAAQKRFVSRRAKKGGKRGFFLTRFADMTREVVKHAEARAREAGSDHVGTEHLLLGLLDQPESLPLEVSRSLWENYAAAIRDEATALIESESAGTAKGHIPFSPDSKKVLELALREALRAHADSIAGEHVLLGILRDQHSPGARILLDCGVTREKVDSWLAP
ncbi:MAG: Clp protease N-terminal domain-containing protein [Acidimicrobiia bacterium]